MRLFALCSAMKWSHLPEPGGLYAQHPQLLADWEYIFGETAKYEKREREEQDRRMKAKSKSGNARTPSRGRRR